MKLFCIAGEASGDRLAAALIAGLRICGSDPKLIGVGGPRMEEAGLRSLFPMEELSVMGLAEILPRYRSLKRRIRQTAEAVIEARPDVLLTVDSPDFAFRVADIVRRKSRTRIVHYVAPTVWAWRPGRARRLAGRIDQLLALLPFEPPYFEAEGLRCDFVGHPVAAEAPPERKDMATLEAKLGGGGPLLAVLPGSRRSEIVRHAPVFGRALAPMLEQHPEMRIVVPTLPHLAPQAAELLRSWPGRPLIATEPELRRAALWHADAALAKSGTVSLELAAARTPMVVAYDMNPVSRWIIRRMLRVDTVTLVNLVSETRTVPEFLGAACRPELIAPALLDVLERPERQLAALDLTMERLGRGGEAPGVRAARAVLDGLNRA